MDPGLRPDDAPWCGHGESWWGVRKIEFTFIAMHVPVSHKDVAILLLALLSTGLVAVLTTDFSVPPFEDAAMLMRYSLHVSQGAGIVWNVGSSPVDGATDFLFMILVAVVHWVGVSVETAVRILVVSSHGLTIAAIYLFGRKGFNAHWLLALSAALYIGFGPALSYIKAYFGTPVFALFATIAWIAAIGIMLNGESSVSASVFALFSLLTGLTRPEGVILTALMLVSVVIKLGVRRSVKTIVAFLIVVGVLGGAYFVWRWWYFGYPLPNPYYRKGAGVIHLDGLVSSVGIVFRAAWPVGVFFAVGLWRSQLRRLAVALAVPLLGFTLAFALISGEMNFGGRFQYVVVPLSVLAIFPLLGDTASLLAGLIRHRAAGTFFAHPYMLRASGAFLLCFIALYSRFIGAVGLYQDGRYDVARSLSNYERQGYVLATSEAGLLPLYSRWTAVDTWGLNDKWIAHHGVVTEAYLDTYSPQLVMFHAHIDQDLTVVGGDGWASMVRVLVRYVESRNYVLAAAYGDTSSDVHLYFVQPDFPDSAATINLIRQTPYTWYGSGDAATDFRALYAAPDGSLLIR